jgi:murein DD-endopeptidase MepM/ murein hydrolase activator NlpD
MADDRDNSGYGKPFTNDPRFSKVLSDTSIDEKVTLRDVHRNINSLSSVLDASNSDLQKRLKSITGTVTSTAVKQQKLLNQMKMRELSSPREIKVVEKSVQEVLGKLGYAVDALTRGTKRILTDTARATKETLREYGDAIHNDFYINKGNMMAMTLAKASPIFGYFAGKFMETSVFQKFSENIKQKLGDAATFTGNKMKDVATRAYGSLKDTFSKNKEVKTGGTTRGPDGRYISGGGRSPAGVPGARANKYSATNEMNLPEVQRGGYVKKEGAAYIHSAEIVAPLEKLSVTMKESLAPMNKTIGSELKQFRYATVGMGNDLRALILEFVGNKSFLYKTVLAFQGLLGAGEIVKFFFGKRNKYSSLLSKSMNPMQKTADNVGVLFTNLMPKLDTIIGNIQLLVRKAGAKPITERDTYKAMATWTRFEMLEKAYKHLKRTGWKGIGAAATMLKRGVLEMNNPEDEIDEKYKNKIFSKLKSKIQQKNPFDKGLSDLNIFDYKGTKPREVNPVKPKMDLSNLNFLPSYASGTNRVPEDQIAKLHKGEAVIPKHKVDSGYGLIGGTGMILVKSLSMLTRTLIMVGRTGEKILSITYKFTKAITTLPLKIGLSIATAATKLITKDILTVLKVPMNMFNAITKAGGVGKAIKGGVQGMFGGLFGKGLTGEEAIDRKLRKEKVKTGVEGELQKIRHSLIRWRAAHDKEWADKHKKDSLMEKWKKLKDTYKQSKEEVKKQWSLTKQSYKDMREMYKNSKTTAKATKETNKTLEHGSISVVPKKNWWEKIVMFAGFAWDFISGAFSTAKDLLTKGFEAVVKAIMGKNAAGMAKDAATAGGAASKLSKATKIGGVVSGGITAYEEYGSNRAKGKGKLESGVRAGGVGTATGLGTWGGAQAGGSLGAMIGTAIAPGPGTAIGGVLGSVIGGGLGAWGSYKAAKAAEKGIDRLTGEKSVQQKAETGKEKGGDDATAKDKPNQPGSLTPEKVMSYYKSMNEDSSEDTARLRDAYNLATESMGEAIKKKKEETKGKSMLERITGAISSGMGTAVEAVKQTAAPVIEKAKKGYETVKTAVGSVVSPAASGLITSLFGPRNTGLRGASKNHKGIDFRAGIGSPITAMEAGKVIGMDPKWGSVFVQHPGGLVSQYTHLSSASVKVGQEVKAGQQIGLAGKTGPIPGMAPHLHFGLKKEGQYIDPQPFLKQHGVQLATKGGLTKEMGGAGYNLNRKDVAGMQAKGSMHEMSMMSNSLGSLGKEIGDSMESSSQRTTNAIIKGGNRVASSTTIINAGGSPGSGADNAIASILNASFA